MLSPMAGIGDPPYRRLCRRGGAALVCAEMVSANALHFDDERSRRMLQTYPDEHPVSLQIFGNDPDRLAAAARAAEAAGADIVDLNCGCPVPKITKSGGGVSLMRDESLFARCVAAMARAVRVPVTVKMRLGFARGENHAPRFARIAEEAGAAAVAVHARSREERHAGAPDLEALAAVTRAVRLPVFGNGGVRSIEDARRMFGRGVRRGSGGTGRGGQSLFFPRALERRGGPRRAALLAGAVRPFARARAPDRGILRGIVGPSAVEEIFTVLRARPASRGGLSRRGQPHRAARGVFGVPSLVRGPGRVVLAFRRGERYDGNLMSAPMRVAATPARSRP
ncbi:MAG: tRNA-dihydrouridine synthase family protein [Elusimicrobia bacterium]|nr:tRNA-dihydrouridine synthase family protein [Elusimicrobiota bacterium]